MKVYIGGNEYASVAEALRHAKPGDAVIVAGDTPSRIYFGRYVCHVCDKDFMVNDAWGPCSPDTCHACTERLTRAAANDE